MDKIFDKDGRLKINPDSDCVFAIRQICLFAKKILIPCSDAKNKSAELLFINCEEELRNHAFKPELLDVFRRVCRVIWSDMFHGIPFGDPYDNYHPVHGPGTTQEGLRGNRKFRFPNWPTRLESEFPYSEFAIGSMSNYGYDPRTYPSSSPLPRDETPVRVVFVPKTQKTPRVIAIEPVCMQYIQQAIAKILIPMIERSSRFTSGRVNFTRQDVNGSLCLSSSRDRSLSTIDLSEASDRVSSKLVWIMLESLPAFRRQVFACRSTRAKLPSGKIIALRKFASMGSALCFPMESMVFFCAIISGMVAQSGRRPTPSLIAKLSSKVHVYGDDIIVPVEQTPLVYETLELFGLKVNRHKSFSRGNFRESCGLDSFNGHDVTPTYVRRCFPVDKTDVQAIASTVSLANQFYNCGLWKTARYVRANIENLLGPLPGVPDATTRALDNVLKWRKFPVTGSAGLGWSTYSNADSFSGWDNGTQRLRDKRYVITPVRYPDPLDGDGALLKWFAIAGSKTVDEDHLRTSVRYGNLALKRRWVLV